MKDLLTWKQLRSSQSAQFSQPAAWFQHRSLFRRHGKLRQEIKSVSTAQPCKPISCPHEEGMKARLVVGVQWAVSLKTPASGQARTPHRGERR